MTYACAWLVGATPSAQSAWLLAGLEASSVCLYKSRTSWFVANSHLSSNFHHSTVLRTQVPLSFKPHSRCPISTQTNTNNSTTHLQNAVLRRLHHRCSRRRLFGPVPCPQRSAVYPSGTGSPSGTGAAPTATVPFNNGAAVATGAGSAMAVLAVGAAALVR